MITEQDILCHAYHLVNEFGLTTGALARNAEGESVTPLDPRATSFCAVGAITRAANDLGLMTWNSRELEGAYKLYMDIAGTPPGMSITQWNDSVGEARVKQAFEQATAIQMEMV